MSENVKVTRWVATIAGLIGFVLSVADAAVAGGADHRDAELAAERSAQ